MFYCIVNIDNYNLYCLIYLHGVDQEWNETGFLKFINAMIEYRSENGLCFATVGAELNEDLKFTVRFNYDKDISSVQNFVSKDKSIISNLHYHMQHHLIYTPIKFNLELFVQEVVKSAKTFMKNQVHERPTEKKSSATWVNTLFKVVDVPAEKRVAAGDFHGLDKYVFDWDENLYTD